MRVHYQSRRVLGLRCRGVLSRLGCEFADIADAELGFSVLGTHIYTREEIAAVPFGIVNLHLAPLPAYRGFYAFSHAIANGEEFFEVTLHYVDVAIDTGPIIATREVAVPDAPAMLAYKASEAGFQLFTEWAPKIVKAAAAGERVPCTAQPAGGHYYGRDSLPFEQRF